MNEYLKNIKNEITKNMKPMVSVITPLFNAEKYVIDAVSSVVAQTYQNWEMIIVDDGSTDNSYHIVESYIKKLPNTPIVLLKNEKNSGISFTRNVAINNSKGKYLFPFDSDDILHPQILEELVNKIEDEQADFCQSYRVIFQNENRCETVAVPNLIDKIPYYALQQNSSLYKREIWEKIGGYCVNPLVHDDWEFYIRAFRFGFRKSVVVNKFLFYYRVHSASGLRTVVPKKDEIMKANIVLNNKELYSEYHIKWANEILAGNIDDFKKIDIFGEMPDLVKLILFFEKNNPNYANIVKQLNEKFINKIHNDHKNKKFELEIFTLQISETKQIQILPFYYPHGVLTAEYKPEHFDLQASSPLSNYNVFAVSTEVYKKQIENNEELVSVIIPLFNQGHFLEDAIKSVVEQTYKNWEIIIVNDCSTDDSLQVAANLAEKYSAHSIYIYSNPENFGLSVSRNAAIKHSNGKYFIPLDSDDKIEPSFIAKCMQVMHDSGVDIVYTDVQEFGTQHGMMESIDFFPEVLLCFNYITGCSLVRKRVWEKVGGYAEGMRCGSEDWHFWISAMKHKFIGKRISEALFLYRKSDSSMYSQMMRNPNIPKAEIILANRELFDTDQIYWAEQVKLGNPTFVNMELKEGCLPLFGASREEFIAKYTLRLQSLGVL